jgi:prepilin-type processing-associated H-X9-DG protein
MGMWKQYTLLSCFQLSQPLGGTTMTSLTRNCGAHRNRHEHAKDREAQPFRRSGPGTTDNGVQSLWVPEISESQVKPPSEMFASTDSKFLKFADNFYSSYDSMNWYYNPEVRTPRHGKGYNVACCDGHVVLVRRVNWLDPSKTALNWNNDNNPHPETWVAPQQ